MLIFPGYYWGLMNWGQWASQFFKSTGKLYIFQEKFLLFCFPASIYVTRLLLGQWAWKWWRKHGGIQFSENIMQIHFKWNELKNHRLSFYLMCSSPNMHISFPPKCSDFYIDLQRTEKVMLRHYEKHILGNTFLPDRQYILSAGNFATSLFPSLGKETETKKI